MCQTVKSFRYWYSWNGQYLNYDLILLNSELEPVDYFLPYDIEKYHYGSNYNSTNNINFISPFYKLSDQYIYFSDLLSDTTYLFDCTKKEIKPFLYHEDNEVARRMAVENDLAVSISLMEESGNYFGSQILFMDENSYIFSSVSGKKVVYIFYDVVSSKYKLIDYIDYSADMSFKHYPLGLPILNVDQNLEVYALLMPHIYSEADLKSKEFDVQDNPAIVKYQLTNVP